MTSMKVLVTGVKGQLGFDVVNELGKRGFECKGVDIDDFDLTKEEQVVPYILDYHPDAVIHCAAFTAVDRAEEQKELCYSVNVLGTRYVAKACKELGCKMVYLSTDYVFSGTGIEYYTTESERHPCNYYGATKSDGEDEVRKLIDKHFIVRISWVFGINGNNFVKTMMRKGEEGAPIRVVKDQIGSPTYTYDLARLLVDMIETEKYGTYHATNEGLCSWYEFTCEIMRLAGFKTKVIPITTEEYPTLAVRPKNSRMSKEKLVENGFTPLPPWKDALERYLDLLRVRENNQN